MGDNSRPFAFKMELWNTVTNEITKVPHPPGYNNNRFHRPVMATYNDNSIILTGSKMFFGRNGESFLPEIFTYKIGEGWSNLGNVTMASKEQFGIYVLKNPKLAAFNSLSNCATKGSVI